MRLLEKSTCLLKQGGGISSCVAKGQRENWDNEGFSKVEPIRPGNKPEIKCRICGKPHLSYKCWNNRDSVNRRSVNDEGRLVFAFIADTSYFQFKGDNLFNRSRGNYRGQGYSEEITAVKVEALEISLIMQQGEATSPFFVNGKPKRVQ